MDKALPERLCSQRERRLRWAWIILISMLVFIVIGVVTGIIGATIASDACINIGIDIIMISMLIGRLAANLLPDSA